MKRLTVVRTLGNTLLALVIVLASAEFSNSTSLGQTEPSEQARTSDWTTLNGKVMCGYQGWFSCEGDGANLGWKHWARNRNRPLGPGNVTVDLWPDLSEYGPDERYETQFKLANGNPAEVFSSFKRETVFRHFHWMRDYGIDGAFVQRFVQGLDNKLILQHRNKVLENARDAATATQRTYALMYDLSGGGNDVVDRVKDDWLQLAQAKETEQGPTYLHHNGKPVIAIWGVGFKDKRKYSLEQCLELVQFFKQKGFTVMLGVPTGWREGTRDSLDDPLLHKIIKQADIVSPWTVGRYRNVKQVQNHASDYLQPDLQWCTDNSIDYLPVVFPGFSWHNLTGEKLNAIPRLKGQFLWSQFHAAKESNCKMIYVAMFDEVDEGTAIFKCTNSPPVGQDVQFLTYESVPSDHYLFLTGQGRRMLRGEIPMSNEMPPRNPAKR